MPEYPLIGPDVLSVFEYIRREQEDIHLGEFTFDFPTFFGLPPSFDYNIDFFGKPIEDEGGDFIYPPTAYGLVTTCDLSCDLPEVTFTYNIGSLISGPAIRVSPGATKDNFTGYALVYNPFDHTLVFGKWINQPLTNYGSPLKKVNGVTLVDGDELKIKVVANNTFECYLNDTLLFYVIDNAIGIVYKCIGAIQLRANSTALPVPGSVETLYEVDHAIRRFFYCDDAITIVDPLLPVLIPDNYFESAIDFALKCGITDHACYGFYYAQLFTTTDVAGPSGRGYYQSAQFIYGGALSGSPRSAIIFRVDESKADPDDFTGYALIIDESTSKLYFCYYINESLRYLPQPSHIIATIDKAYPAGSLIYFNFFQPADDIEANWEINIYTQRPSESYIQDIHHMNANEIHPGAQGVDRQANSNIGFAWIGNDNIGNHIARWNGAAVDNYMSIE